MTIQRVIGVETEFGVLEPGNAYANPIRMSAQIIDAYAPSSRAVNDTPVRFDYIGEDPLQDMRGHRLDRAAAHPSQLTDDPNWLAPSGGAVTHVARDSYIPRGGGAPNIMLANGARFYVDHAHPEYSSPEVTSPAQAVLYDKAGDEVARRAMAACDDDIVLYKNNTDGKGASYGAHENYLIDRSVPFRDVAQTLIPFMVTRPVICGAGRVGIGQHSDHDGFQMSQRADFVENDIGLETTFNRPIINTRDEPHATRDTWRRLHVIGGDANQADYSIYLKVGAMSAVLWLCEHTDFMDEAAAWAIKGDPVEQTWAVSHDIDLTHTIETVDGRHVTALDYQEFYCQAFRRAVGDNPDQQTADFITTWQDVIDDMRRDKFLAADRVEWVAKLQLLDGMRQRLGVGWLDPRLQSMDVMWHDLRHQTSLFEKMVAAGRIRRMYTPEQVNQAVTTPPSSTRAYIRGRLVDRFNDIVKAGWVSVTADTGRRELQRLSLGDPLDINPDVMKACDGDSLEAVFEAIATMREGH